MVFRKLSASFFNNLPRFNAYTFDKVVSLQKPGWPSLTWLASRSFRMQSRPSVNPFAINRIGARYHGKDICTFGTFNCIDIHNSCMVSRRFFAVKIPSRPPPDKDEKDPFARFRGLDPTKPKLGFDKVKALDDANESVKKIFSLEFADDSEINVYRRAKVVKAVQNDTTDTSSLPVRIALQTLNIRSAAKQLALTRKDMAAKQMLLGVIGRRRRTLKNLRRRDYERFERILKELGITYVLPPVKVRFHTRRYLEKVVVRKKARDEKLTALREFLGERRRKQLEEIAILKKELGHDLTKEEEDILAGMKEES